MKLVEKRIFIAASPTRVYELLTDADLLVEWMAPHAELDPRPGGALMWTHVNGDSVVGTFVELVALSPHRVHLRLGSRRRPHPTGIDHREIDLRRTMDGTELRLVHRGLADPMANAHSGGWSNYLARLAAVAEGRGPGPDPLAAERVPAARDEGLP